MDSLLKVVNINKSFGGVKALSDISFEIYEGEKVSLVGENGSGKSTIIKIISGILAPDSGSITIGSVTKKFFTPKESIKAGVQVIYQDFSLYPNLTICENIANGYFLSNKKVFISYKKMQEIAMEALDKVKLNIPLKTIANNLTTAQRQMVAISKCLLENAKIIIMDEATTALTQKEIKNLINIIEDLQSSGISIIFVSHKIEEIKAVSDRCIFIRNGIKISEQKTLELTEEDIVKNMSGLSYIKTRPVLYESNNYLLEYKDVKTKNLNNISFNVKAGEIIGFSGLLGSGRTELGLSIFGNKKILDGKTYFNGNEVKIDSVYKAINLGIGYVPEDRIKEALFLDKSIGLNIISARYYDDTLPFGIINNKKLCNIADTWMKELSIKSPSANLPVSSLSGGNQQRVVLARWLTRNLKLIILNRPTVGVDVASKQYINKMIIDLASKGMSFILISDDLNEFVNLCHKVYLLKNGKISSFFLQDKDITVDNIKKQLL